MTARGCSIEGCDNPHESRGMCQLHYTRWRNGRRGESLAAPKFTYPPRKGCNVEGCQTVHQALGYCGAHYFRFHRYGDPLGTPTTARKGIS